MANRLHLTLSADSEDFCRRLALLESGRPRQNVAAVLAENFSRAERAERLAVYRKKLRILLDNQDKLDGEALRASRRLVRELQDRLIAMAARTALDAERSVSWGTYWLQTLEREAAAAVAAFGRYYAVDLGPWLEKSALNGLAMTDAVLDAVGLDSFVGLTRETIRTAATWSGDLIVNLSQGALERVNQEVRLSLVTGEGVDKLIGRLQGPLSERGTALGSVAYQAERVARTEIAGAQATATQMRQEEVAATYPELRLQKMFVAAHILEWPCPQCSPYDGKVFDVDDPEAPQVPIHSNCRCTYVSHVPGLSERPAAGERAETVVAGPRGIPTDRQQRASVVR